MKRIPIHAVFALAAAAALAAVAVQALRLQQAHQLNRAIAEASQPPAATGTATAGATPASAASGAGVEPAVPAVVARDAPREVRLAQATALSQAGAFDAAFKGFSGLIEPGGPDAVGRHALYNLGNMVLRQGLGASAGGDGAAPRSPAEAGPLIELAKQRYRDLLRADPGDWDARYNLERALRAAPEDREAVAEEPATPVERRNVLLRGMNPGDLP